MPCTKKNSYLSIRDFAEGRDGTIYVASTSGVRRVRSGLLVPYSNPYITGETALMRWESTAMAACGAP